jgi:hypothetical protein
LERKRGRPKKEKQKTTKERYHELKERMEAEGRVQVGTWLKGETLEWLKEEALKEDTSIGGIIDELVEGRNKTS